MIDPIQFKPYNPRKDNQPIYAVDQSKGMDANRRRILEGMDANERIRKMSDQTKVRNAEQFGKNIQALGKFSETLADLGTDAMNMYIDAEEDKAIADSFTSGMQPSEAYTQEDKEAAQAEAVTNQGLRKFEENGGSPLVSEAVRTGSWWYNRKRNELALTDAASNFPLWFAENADKITININGEQKSWSDIRKNGSAADFAAYKASVFQQYSQGFRGYSKDAMAKTFFPQMAKTWDGIQREWIQERSKQIEANRTLERVQSLGIQLKQPGNVSTILDGEYRNDKGKVQLAADLEKFAGTSLENTQAVLRFLDEEYADRGKQGKASTLAGSYLTLTELKTKLNSELNVLRRQRNDTQKLDAQDTLKELRAKAKEKVFAPGTEADIVKQLIDNNPALASYKDQLFGILTNSEEARIDATAEEARQQIEAKQSITLREAEALKEKYPDLYAQAEREQLVETDQTKLTEDQVKDVRKKAESIANQFVSEETGGTVGARTAKYGNAVDNYEREILARFKNNLFENPELSREQALRLALADVQKEGESLLDMSIPDVSDIRAQRASNEVVSTFNQDGRLETALWTTTEQLNQLERWATRGDVGIPENVQYAARLSGKSATQLAIKQLELAGKDIPPELQEAQDMLDTIPPDIQELIYRDPTPAAFMQAKTQSGTPVEGQLQGVSAEDFRWLAYAVAGEAEPGGDDEFAVAAAILNRVSNPAYPNTVHDVIAQSGQYEAYSKGTMRHDDGLVQRLMSPEGQQAIINQLINLDGRTDFKGQTQIANKGSSDYMATPKGNFFHYAQEGNAGPGFVFKGPKPQGWRQYIRQNAAPKVSVAPSPWNDPNNLNPSLLKHVYNMDTKGYGSTGIHLDVKPVQSGGVLGDPNKRMTVDELDQFVYVDKSGTKVPLSQGTVVTADDVAHRNRGSYGVDYAPADRSRMPVYIGNGAKVIENWVDNSARGDGSHRTVIELPDGRRYSFIHGTAA